MSALVEYYFTKRKKLYCAFIDFKKAFDFINRAALWLKLNSIGVNTFNVGVRKSLSFAFFYLLFTR